VNLPSENECIFDRPDFRYVLRRKPDWMNPTPSPSPLVFIMLNPSTADEQKLDPTLTRCWRWTIAWGFDEMVIVNLFAYRTPHPAVLFAAGAPIGSANDLHIDRECERAGKIIVAWGTHAHGTQRAADVLARLSGRPLFCLGRTKAGAPIHPMARGKSRVPDIVQPVPFA
jgi:hypothetical protein